MPNEDNVALSVVKDKDGKYLTVVDTDEGLKMCAVERQNEENAPSVQIKTRANDKNEIKLIFQYGDRQYFPEVDGENLKLLQKASDSTDSGGSWFQKVNQGTGEHYGLQTVAEPRRYLSRLNSRRKTLILAEKPQRCVLITDKSRS